MKKIILIFIIICVTMLPIIARAGCDPCIQAAAQSANASMTSSINTVTTSVQANISATQALNASLQAVNTSLQATIKLNTQQLLQGLSASTNRIELSIQQNTKTVERMADHTVKSLVNALKDVRVAEEVSANNKTYSAELAQPLSGVIGANRAPLLKQGFVQANQIWKQISNDMYDWNSNGGTSKSDQGLKELSLSLEKDEVWNPIPLVAERQITKEQSINLQKLLTILVNPVPLPAATDKQKASNSGVEKYELDRKILNAKLGLAHSVLAKSIADKQAIIPISTNDWQQGYVTSIPDSEGKVSLLSMLESETIGKLSSEGWYQDIKIKTEAGILREQVYQQAINNHMLLRLVEQEEQKLSMLALLAISEIEKTKPVPPTL